MKIMIGTNLKRLRAEKGVTQEQLAEAMNVTCAAVSKWERGESYPDITMLQPLAFYFGITLDTLIGYDKEKVNEEIENVIKEYRRNLHKNREKSRKIIINAYKNYPDDYRIMYYYMWSFGVEDAEPDLQIALAHKEEISRICDKILDGCNNVSLCLGAWKMKAILLHAEGKTDEALTIHSEKFPDWYFSTGQMNEQLFTKDKPEFLYWAKRNMYELADFAADKIVKSKIYDPDITYDKKISSVEKTGDGLYRLGCELDSAYLTVQANSLFVRLRKDLIFREFLGATDEDIIRITEKCLAAAAKLSEMSKTDKPLFDALVKRFNTDDPLSYTLNSALSSKNPRSVKLLENKAYRAVLEKYKYRRHPETAP